MIAGISFIRWGIYLGIGVYLTHGTRLGEFFYIIGLLILIGGVFLPICELIDMEYRKMEE
jgi:hypothetical protein